MEAIVDPESEDSLQFLRRVMARVSPPRLEALFPEGVKQGHPKSLCRTWITRQKNIAIKRGKSRGLSARPKKQMEQKVEE